MLVDEDDVDVGVDDRLRKRLNRRVRSAGEDRRRGQRERAGDAARPHLSLQRAVFDNRRREPRDAHDGERLRRFEPDPREPERRNGLRWRQADVQRATERDGARDRHGEAVAGARARAVSAVRALSLRRGDEVEFAVAEREQARVVRPGEVAHHEAQAHDAVLDGLYAHRDRGRPRRGAVLDRIAEQVVGYYVHEKRVEEQRRRVRVRRAVRGEQDDVPTGLGEAFEPRLEQLSHVRVLELRLVDARGEVQQNALPYRRLEELFGHSGERRELGSDRAGQRRRTRVRLRAAQGEFDEDDDPVLQLVAQVSLRLELVVQVRLGPRQGPCRLQRLLLALRAQQDVPEDADALAVRALRRHDRAHGDFVGDGAAADGVDEAALELARARRGVIEEGPHAGDVARRDDVGEGHGRVLEPVVAARVQDFHLRDLGAVPGQSQADDGVGRRVQNADLPLRGPDVLHAVLHEVD
mmetsp:Transcript_22851/g.77294  ORF Transcript_22851/g.77294 Transcript_22851/m.77294 type:complete len:467 (-) Transcript_22851:1303-2703(-)